MASPGQKRRAGRHLVAGFDSHSQCAHCRDKGKDNDDLSAMQKDCLFCDVLTSEQRTQL